MSIDQRTNTPITRAIMPTAAASHVRHERARAASAAVPSSIEGTVTSAADADNESNDSISLTPERHPSGPGVKVEAPETEDHRG